MDVALLPLLSVAAIIALTFLGSQVTALSSPGEIGFVRASRPGHSRLSPVQQTRLSAYLQHAGDAGIHSYR